MEGHESKGSFNVMEGRELVVAKSSSSSSIVGTCDLVLRVLGLVLTLVAALVIGADKQTAIVPIKLMDSMPTLYVPLTAKWHYLSAFLYYVGANAIACGYATVSLLLTLGNRRMETLINVVDPLMVALLFSGNGAAIAVGLLGLQGNSHLHWNKVCDVFGKFCDQVAASLFMSLLGSMAFLLLLMLPPLFRLKRST